VYVLQTDVPNSTSKNAPGSSSGGKDPNVQGLPYNSCQLEDRGRDGHHVFTDPWGGAARASRPDSLFLQPRPLTGAFGGAATLFAVTYLVRISSIYNCGWRVRRYGPPPSPPPRSQGPRSVRFTRLFTLCTLLPLCQGNTSWRGRLRVMMTRSRAQCSSPARIRPGLSFRCQALPLMPVAGCRGYRVTPCWN
jgi:hypothetical protein